MPPKTPQKIDRYEVKELLGTGSFATVWRAHDPVTGLDVALKVLADNWAQNHEMQDRFSAEARIGLSINSTRIVRVHTVDETADGVNYIVMTYADGGTLADRIDARAADAEGPPYSLHESLDFAEAIALGLADLHDAGHMHRDIKPANVLFHASPKGEQLLLGDFGLARAVDNTALTMISGSPGYVAPEQAGGQTQLTTATDLYPLGIILTELLTGEPPVAATSMSTAASQGPVNVAGHFARLGYGAPAELLELIGELLEVDPDRRPESAAEVARRVAAIRADSPATLERRTPIPASEAESPVVPEPKSSRARWLPAAGLAALLAVGGGVVVVDQFNDGDPGATTLQVGELASDVPLPAGSVIDQFNTRAGEQTDADVARSIDEVIDFYQSADGWTIRDEQRSDDQVVLVIERGTDLARVTLTAAALTSGTDVTNMTIVGLTSE